MTGDEFDKWPPDNDLPDPPKEKYMPKKDELTLKWELLEADDNEYDGPNFQRARVHNGWILRQVGDSCQWQYIYDPMNDWS